MRTIIPKDARLVPDKAKLVFKGQIFDVYQWQQEMFDSTHETFEMLKRDDTIEIFAIKDEKVVILDQEQPDLQPFFTLPGGRHDNENETELDAAKREMLEETGMTFTTWRLIDVQQPYLKMDWFVYVYLATGFESQTKQKLDAGEKIEVKLLSFEETKRLASDPKVRYLQKDILDKVSSIEELTNFPEYQN